MTWSRALAVGVVAVLASALAGAPSRARGADALALSHCNVPPLGEARCGKFGTYEDRVSHSGRGIALNLVVFPAAARPAGSPIFVLAGGPGEGATDLIAGLNRSLLTRLKAHHDLVFLDQRGTGKSHALDCPFFTSVSDYLAWLFPPQHVKECRAVLSKSADLNRYDSTTAAGDLDDVRKALGYRQIIPYGLSYGSTEGLIYLRSYPSGVERIMLAGVAPIDDKTPLSFARGAQAALHHLEADCASDEICHRSFPDFAREFNALNARITAAPLKVSVLDGGRRFVDATLTRQVFVDRLRQMMYSSEAAGYVPLLTHEAYRGNTRPLANALLLLGRGLESGIAQGMFLSVTCAEDIPFISEREIREQTRGTFYGANRIRAQQAACRTWNVKPAPPSFLRPVKSDVPALFLSGADDPATPPWLAKALLSNFARGRQVVFPHSGHELGGPCFNALVVKFADTGKVDDGSTCAGGSKRPAFATSLPSFLR